MAVPTAALSHVLQQPAAFLWQVLTAFRENQGLLLAGAVAYYTLLSIVPMFALLLILLAQFPGSALLLDTVGTYLELAAPTRPGELVADLGSLPLHWKVGGVAGWVVGADQRRLVEQSARGGSTRARPAAQRAWFVVG